MDVARAPNATRPLDAGTRDGGAIMRGGEGGVAPLPPWAAAAPAIQPLGGATPMQSPAMQPPPGSGVISRGSAETISRDAGMRDGGAATRGSCAIMRGGEGGVAPRESGVIVAQASTEAFHRDTERALPKAQGFSESDRTLGDSRRGSSTEGGAAARDKRKRSPTRSPPPPLADCTSRKRSPPARSGSSWLLRCAPPLNSEP